LINFLGTNERGRRDHMASLILHLDLNIQIGGLFQQRILKKQWMRYSMMMNHHRLFKTESDLASKNEDEQLEMVLAMSKAEYLKKLYPDTPQDSSSQDERQ